MIPTLGWLIPIYKSETILKTSLSGFESLTTLNQTRTQSGIFLKPIGRGAKLRITSTSSESYSIIDHTETSMTRLRKLPCSCISIEPVIMVCIGRIAMVGSTHQSDDTAIQTGFGLMKSERQVMFSAEQIFIIQTGHTWWTKLKQEI